MKNAVKVVSAIAAVAVMVVMVAGNGLAQTDDVLGCTATQYDFNGDSRLMKGDLNHFVTAAKADGCWEGRVAEGGSCGVYDLNGDQSVDPLDLEAPHAALMQCISNMTLTRLAGEK